MSDVKYDPLTQEITITDKDGKVVARQKRKEGRTVYTPSLAKKVLDKIADGCTITDISRRFPSLPNHRTIYYWRRHYPEFKEACDIALMDRADYYADKVIEVAEETKTKGKVAVNKLKIEAYKWRAEVDKPDTYGKLKQQEKSDAPITIIINTGVPQSEHSIKNQKEVESQVIEVEKKKKSLIIWPNRLSTQAMSPDHIKQTYTGR